MAKKKKQPADAIKRPHRKCDLVLRVSGFTVRFWWKERIQSNSKWNGYFLVNPKNWTYRYTFGDGQLSLPHSYSNTGWFDLVESTVKNSYAVWALEQQIFKNRS